MDIGIPMLRAPGALAVGARNLVIPLRGSFGSKDLSQVSIIQATPQYLQIEFRLTIGFKNRQFDAITDGFRNLTGL